MIKNRNDEVIIRFGKRVKEIRLARNLTQYQMSIDADIPLSQVGRIERGEVNITISSMHALAVALGISKEQFFNDSTIEKKKSD